MDEHIQSHLDAIRSVIEKDSKSSESSFEKLIVALAGIFRLLDGKQPILAALQGSPTDVQGYVLKLLGEVRQQVSGSYEDLTAKVDDLAKQLESL